MKRILKSSLLMISLLTWTIVASADAQLVYGQWGTKFEQDGFSLVMVVNIAPASTVLTNTCSYAGESLTVSVEVPSEVTDTEYKVLGTAEKTDSKNGLDCSVTAEAATMNYEVVGNVLRLMSNGESIELQRL